MPNRIIRDVGLTSRKLAAVSDWGERLYWRIYQAVDDFGRYHGEPSLLRARCLPFMLDRYSEADVRAGRDELAAIGLLTLYRVGADNFIQITKFDQRRRAEKSKFPSPDDGTVLSLDGGLRAAAAVVVDVNRESRIEGGGVVGEPPPPAPVRAIPAQTPTELPAAVDSLPPPAYVPPEPVAECLDCTDLLRMLADGGVYFASPGQVLLAKVHAAHVGCGMDLAKRAVRAQLDSLRGGDRRYLAPKILFDPPNWEVTVNAVKGRPVARIPRV